MIYYLDFIAMMVGYCIMATFSGIALVGVTGWLIVGVEELIARFRK